MAQFKDPVCGMTVEPETAAGTSVYQGTTYYFCSAACVREFEDNPSKYLAGAELADQSPALERHEPPYTKTDGIVSPKFGAAGSGGAEYERLPEAHD